MPVCRNGEGRHGPLIDTKLCRAKYTSRIRCQKSNRSRGRPPTSIRYYTERSSHDRGVMEVGMDTTECHYQSQKIMVRSHRGNTTSGDHISKPGACRRTSTIACYIERHRSDMNDVSGCSGTAPRMMINPQTIGPYRVTIASCSDDTVRHCDRCSTL
jgi:hypothetical protein